MSERGPDIHVAPEVAELFPGFELAVVRLRGVDNRANPGALDADRAAAIADVERAFADVDVRAHPAIEIWRESYRRFGTNPKKRRPTLEAVVRRVMQGNGLPSISPVVDAYLIAELENLVPLGGYDVNRLEGDVELRRSHGAEPFLGIGETEASLTNEGEIVYSDAARVLTRHWNYRDCDAAKITPDSTEVILVAELLDPTRVSVESVGRRVADLVTRVCGGAAEVAGVGP